MKLLLAALLFSALALFVKEAEGHKRKCSYIENGVYKKQYCTWGKKCCISGTKRYCDYHCSTYASSHEREDGSPESEYGSHDRYHDDNDHYRHWRHHKKAIIIAVSVGVVLLIATVAGVVACVCCVKKRRQNARGRVVQPPINTKQGLSNPCFDYPLQLGPPGYDKVIPPAGPQVSAPEAESISQEKIPL